MARTRTYIAGDWTGDEKLIQQLYKWNESNYWNLHFVDAHKDIQASDKSLSCSIKKSLQERLDISKTFVLVVGKHTLNLTRGSCANCPRYSSSYGCTSGGSVSLKSFIEYECDKAVRDGLNIIVIYNYANVDKSKCPIACKNVGTHVNGYYYQPSDVEYYWNYSGIKDAFNKAK